MIKWFGKNNKDEAPPSEAGAEDNSAIAVAGEGEAASEQIGIFSRLRKGLSKTRHQLGDSLGRLLLGKKELDAELLDSIETILLGADLGIETTRQVLANLTDKLVRQQLSDGKAVFQALKTDLQQLITMTTPALDLQTADGSPFVIMVVGVNGAGKTTTIGKLAYQYQKQGKKVMLAAGDTFRAAAVEQLKVWGDKNNIPVIAQETGADSASVIFDALAAAKARGYDILIADTAGRLHTQMNLMEELKKISRVMKKICPLAPHETILILDGSIGQNALNQARQFHQALGLSGIVMTKLDGTAKGGILFAIANELKLPFRYLGVGEGIEDLRPFDAVQFVNAILSHDNIQSGE